jgi:hypothetical protein
VARLLVTCYYYLSYPDHRPIDPTYAATEMYVERGNEGDTIEHFQDTYAFHVYTFRYAQEEFIQKGRVLTGRAVMIVPTLADDWMESFLDENVDALAEWGEPK